MQISAALDFIKPLDTLIGWQDPADRLLFMLCFSALLHLFILYGVSVRMPDFDRESSIAPLEVVLVNSKSRSRPVNTRMLAQANLDGGGQTDADRQAKSPLPVLNRELPEAVQANPQTRVHQLEEKALDLLAQLEAKRNVESSPTRQENKPQAHTDAATLMERSLEAARLEAQIAQDWERYQKRPRRRFLGARTQEYRFAAYMEDWRAKVERVGNMNYPEAAKQRKLYGNLQLTVSIKPDGSVEDIQINRSSGHKVLDTAAIRIVELAAPFAPFPESIRRDTDVLGITRTWIFTRADQLTSQ
ncbi:MAG: energy transducer TonB [Burkholderiales bacterium]